MRFWALLLALLFAAPPAMAQVTLPAPQTLVGKCEAGDADACYAYGMLYEAGKQVPEDRAKAAHYYTMACDKGSAHGCWELAILYANGTGVPQNWELSHKYDERACDGGMAVACDGAGYDYAMGGRGVPKDKLAAQSYYQRAANLWSRDCDKGDGDSCQHLSILLRAGNPTQAREVLQRAAMLWQAACDTGEIRACVSVGSAYANGWGVVRNQDMAAASFRRACQMGDAGGCNGFGQLALDGHPAGAGPAEIVAALDSRCQSGDEYRCSLLGEAYADGKMGPRDAAKAMAYFAKGCDPAYRTYHTFGCIRFALGFLHGDGAPQDRFRAISILTKLCEDQGGACFALGKIYFRGDAVEQDLGKARDRFEDGCDADNELSCYAQAAMAYEGKGGEVDKAKAASLVAKACQGRRAPEKLCVAPYPSTTFLEQAD